MKINFLFTAIFAVLALSGCQVYTAPFESAKGNPATLLDLSAEIISFDLDSRESFAEINDWVNTDLPTKAELHCLDTDQLCIQSQDLMYNMGVDYEVIESADNTVILVYERVLSRDCSNRYLELESQVDGHYLTFGCSIAGNMVQMVTEKQQFTSPNLLDYRDAESAIVSHSKSINNTDNYTGSLIGRQLR